MNTRNAMIAAEWARQRDAILAAFPDLDPETLADTLEGLSDLPEVMDDLIHGAQEAEAMAKAVGEIAADNTERKQRLKRRADRLRQAAQALMEAAGEQKFQRPDYTLSLRKVPPKAVVTELEELPDDYCKLTRSADLNKIKEALKDGTVIPGAYLTNESQSVSVRTK